MNTTQLIIQYTLVIYTRPTFALERHQRSSATRRRNRILIEPTSTQFSTRVRNRIRTELASSQFSTRVHRARHQRRQIRWSNRNASWNQSWIQPSSKYTCMARSNQQQLRVRIRDTLNDRSTNNRPTVEVHPITH